MIFIFYCWPKGNNKRVQNYNIIYVMLRLENFSFGSTIGKIEALELDLKLQVVIIQHITIHCCISYVERLNDTQKLLFK